MIDTRLKLVAGLCGGTKRMIDVGCDHAYLCIYLALNRGVERAYAADINEGPLKAARANIEKYGLGKTITPVLADGLRGFDLSNVDCAVISGLGGETIIKILEYAPQTKNGVSLVLQPMTKVMELRRFLYGNGYIIEDERLARENDILYVALKARGGAADMPGHFLFTPGLENDPLFPDYVEGLYKKYGAIARGLEKAGLDPGDAEKNLNILSRAMKNSLK